MSVTTPSSSSQRGFNLFEEVVSGVALVVVIAATCWGVISRYVTAQPAAWAGELATIAFAWVVFVGAAAGFKYGMHVSIDMLVARFPAGLRRALMGAADLLVLAFLALLVVLALEFSVDSWEDPTSVLRLPRTVVYASMFVGALCMLLRYGQTAWRRWKGLPGAWLEMPGEAGSTR